MLILKYRREAEDSPRKKRKLNSSSIAQASAPYQKEHTVGRIKPRRDVLEEKQTKKVASTLPISEEVGALTIQPKEDRLRWKDSGGITRTQCKVLGCYSRSQLDGLCAKHFNMFVKAGRETKDPEEC